MYKGIRIVHFLKMGAKIRKKSFPLLILLMGLLWLPLELSARTISPRDVYAADICSGNPDCLTTLNNSSLTYVWKGVYNTWGGKTSTGNQAKILNSIKTYVPLDIQFSLTSILVGFMNLGWDFQARVADSTSTPSTNIVKNLSDFLQGINTTQGNDQTIADQAELTSVGLIFLPSIYAVRASNSTLFHESYFIPASPTSVASDFSKLLILGGSQYVYNTFIKDEYSGFSGLSSISPDFSNGSTPFGAAKNKKPKSHVMPSPPKDLSSDVHAIARFSTSMRKASVVLDNTTAPPTDTVTNASTQKGKTFNASPLINMNLAPYLALSALSFLTSDAGKVSGLSGEAKIYAVTTTPVSSKPWAPFKSIVPKDSKGPTAVSASSFSAPNVTNYNKGTVPAANSPDEKNSKKKSQRIYFLGSSTPSSSGGSGTLLFAVHYSPTSKDETYTQAHQLWEQLMQKDPGTPIPKPKPKPKPKPAPKPAPTPILPNPTPKPIFPFPIWLQKDPHKKGKPVFQPL